MNTQTKKIDRKQQGFAGVVFLVIALIAIIMTAIAVMSRNNASGTPEQSTKTNAAVLLKQSSDLKTGFDRMMIDGKSASVITFDQGTEGLFGKSSGTIYAAKPIPPALAVTSGAVPIYTYNNLARLPGVGISTGDDIVFTVANVTLDVCRQINRLLYNDAADATPVDSTGSLVQWTTLAAFDDSGVTAYSGRPEGCVRSATSGPYIYYKAAFEN